MPIKKLLKLKAKSEIRKAYLLNKYVIITPGRAKRPRDIKEETIVKRTMACPFCVGNIDNKSIKDQINGKISSKAKKEKNKWDVLSVKNIFPAVSLDNPKAYGAQEVVIETRDHERELADLSIAHIEKVLRMFACRTKALAQNKKIDYILCFKNQGSKAGASIVHAHSQIFATEILPPQVKEELEEALAYQLQNGICAYCDILKKEIKSPRKIWEDKYVGAFAPYASEYHYEAWIFIKRHLDNITKLNNQEFKSFAKCLKHILTKLQSLNLSFNFFLHQAVSDQGQHFYLKIQPRDSIWAGLEIGSGIVINSVSPEAAAKFYKA